VHGAAFARKAIGRSRILRRLVKSGLGQRVIQGVRGASLVRRPVRFVMAEVRGLTSRHTLRAGPAIHLRHGTRDVDILSEIFARGNYEPPPGVPVGDVKSVLDVGANIGLFGAYATAKWPGAAVTSYEPDPENQKLLRATATWPVKEVAVSNHNGVMPFAAGLFSEAHLGQGENTIDVPVVDLYDETHDVDLLKMDIEGGEWAILTDPRLRDLAARVIVLEWHAQGCPEPDAHGAVTRLLKEAGYAGMVDLAEHEDNGVVWAWRAPGS
jgi:FkbM family methyltransferase